MKNNKYLNLIEKIMLIILVVISVCKLFDALDVEHNFAYKIIASLSCAFYCAIILAKAVDDVINNKNQRK